MKHYDIRSVGRGGSANS